MSISCPPCRRDLLEQPGQVLVVALKTCDERRIEFPDLGDVEETFAGRVQGRDVFDEPGYTRCLDGGWITPDDETRASDRSASGLSEGASGCEIKKTRLMPPRSDSATHPMKAAQEPVGHAHQEERQRAHRDDRVKDQLSEGQRAHWAKPICFQWECSCFSQRANHVSFVW
jgi:hypothetical protein